MDNGFLNNIFNLKIKIAFTQKGKKQFINAICVCFYMKQSKAQIQLLTKYLSLNI